MNLKLVHLVITIPSYNIKLNIKSKDLVLKYYIFVVKFKIVHT